MVSSGVVSNGVEWCGVKWCQVSIMMLESLVMWYAHLMITKFNCISEPKRNTMTYSLRPSIERKMNHKILSSLIPIFESWSGQKLAKYGTVYGRRYLRGASLLMHLDGHAFSDSYNLIANYFAAILQVK